MLATDGKKIERKKIVEKKNSTRAAFMLLIFICLIVATPSLMKLAQAHVKLGI